MEHTLLLAVFVYIAIAMQRKDTTNESMKATAVMLAFWKIGIRFVNTLA